MEQVKYTSNADDLVAFDLYARLGKAPGDTTHPIGPAWLVPVLLISACVIFAFTSETTEEIIPYLPLAALALAVWYVVQRPQMAHRIAAYQIRLAFSKGTYQLQRGEQCLSIAPESITLDSQLGRTVFYWTTVESVETVGEYLAVRIRPNQVIFVPLRAFTDQNTVEAFAEKMREYKRVAASS